MTHLVVVSQSGESMEIDLSEHLSGIKSVEVNGVSFVDEDDLKLRYEQYLSELEDWFQKKLLFVQGDPLQRVDPLKPSFYR